MEDGTLPLLDELLRKPTNAEEEARILDILRTCTPGQLDALVRGLEGPRLFESLDDRLAGPDNETELVRLLTVERVGDLSPEARVALSYSLQAGRTSRRDEEGVRNLVLAHRGEELTRYKNLLNARTDVHDLEGLVFVDVDDEAIREEILANIAAEAAGVDARKAKVLSDIDDTVVARLHDGRYPKGTLYPGVLAVYEALDTGPDDAPFSKGDLTFVTARPMDAFGLIENSTRASLARAGIATASVLSGSFLNLLTHDSMAAKKLQNIDHYHKLFPEYRLLFMGDSGQGDVAVGEKLHELYPGKLDVVIIHDVVDTPPERRAEYAAQGIYFHDTYVGAATVLRERGLISDAGLRRVVEEAMTGLDAVRWRSAEQERRMRDLFDRDVAAARV